LTELILRENGMTADIKEFDAEMQQQKQRARNAAAIETGDWITLKEGTTEFVGTYLTAAFGIERSLVQYNLIQGLVLLLHLAVAQNGSNPPARTKSAERMPLPYMIPSVSRST